VRDHQRHDPAAAQVEQAEHDAHHHVADEGAEALVEVVGAAQHGARRDDRAEPPLELAQPGDQVADHDHLLQHRVLHGGQDQHRHRPPHLGQRGRHQRGVDAELGRRPEQRQAGQTDQRGQAGAPGQVLTGPPGVQAERPRRVAGVPRQQVYGEQHGQQRETDPEQLVREVQPRPGGHGGVERGGLLRQRPVGGQLRDDRHRRVDGGLAEGEAEHQQRLGAEHPAGRRAVQLNGHRTTVPDADVGGSARAGLTSRSHILCDRCARSVDILWAPDPPSGEGARPWTTSHGC
jgi:hypothetical protein